MRVPGPFFIATSNMWWRRQWHPTPVLLPGKSHGQRSLVGFRPWGRWRSDTTERLHVPFSLSCIGEGNGNPLYCSCLENPRDGGAWWAAIYGVTESQTRLKQLSNSNIIVPIRGQSKTRTIFTFFYLNMKRGNKTQNEKMDRNGGDNFYNEILLIQHIKIKPVSGK